MKEHFSLLIKDDNWSDDERIRYLDLNRNLSLCFQPVEIYVFYCCLISPFEVVMCHFTSAAAVLHMTNFENFFCTAIGRTHLLHK